MNSFKHNSFRIYLTLFMVVGIVLRLWQWSSQILLDDEWHALNFVLNRSFFDVFLQQGLGANSIPVNVYSWIVLHTTGWSEPLLRLPSMVAGISSLVVIPMLVKRVWGNYVACVTAALLAVSPVVIFYSRIMRPYAPAMLLAISSLLLTLVWLKEGKRRDLLLSAMCGSLAIYYHLYTAIPVGVPLFVAFVAAIKPVGKRLGLILESERPFSDLLLAGCIMAVIDGVLVVVPNVLNPWWSHGIHGVDHATLETVVTVLSLISGTRNPLLMIIILGLLLTGFVAMVLRSRVIGVAMISSFLVFTLVMAITTQDGSHAGIQVARYGITYFPLSFVTVALALAWIGDVLKAKFSLFRRKSLSLSAALVIWFPFLATSPLLTTYSSPNNFTNHSAYQYRYDPIQWQQHSPERDLMPGINMEFKNIPKFYLQSPLLKSAKGVIEYPVLIGDQRNLYYYYQHFHRLPVVAGFVSNNLYGPVIPGRDFVFGEWSFDSVMSGMPGVLRKKMSWHTMVDLNDSKLLRSRFKGWIVIIHCDPLYERNFSDSSDNRMNQKMVNEMAKIFGNPKFADSQIAVWLIE